MHLNSVYSLKYKIQKKLLEQVQQKYLIHIQYKLDHRTKYNLTPAPNFKQQHKISYSKIDPDKEIQVEPLPTQMSSAMDNDMWVKVKYNAADQRPQQPDSLRLGRRSSSMSNLTNTMMSASGSDCYSNLGGRADDQCYSSKHSRIKRSEKTLVHRGGRDLDHQG